MKKLQSFTKELEKIWNNTGIYCIKFKHNNNLIYIGQASKIGYKKPSHNGFYYRWLTHIRQLENQSHHNKRIQRIINKYTIKDLYFEIIEILEANLSIDKYYEKENYYINYYINKSYDVLNFSHEALSFRGCKHSEKTKIKLSKIKKGKKQHPNTYKAILKANIGRIKTKEEKEKISKANKGKIISQETRNKLSKTLLNVTKSNRRKVIAFNTEKELIFSSYIETSEFFGVSKSFIRYCCNNNKEYKTFKFKYNRNTTITNEYWYKHVMLYNNDIFIKKFKSYTEAAKYIGISLNSIRRRIIDKNPIIKNTKLYLQK